VSDYEQNMGEERQTNGCMWDDEMNPKFWPIEWCVNEGECLGE